MPTVIIGGSIIGCSTVYSLSEPSSPNDDDKIHIIDTSPTMFDCFSGYSAGFIAKDWFADEFMPLGELSFDLYGASGYAWRGKSLLRWWMGVVTGANVRGWGLKGPTRSEL